MSALHMPPMEVMGVESVKGVIKNEKGEDNGQKDSTCQPSECLVQRASDIHKHGQCFDAMPPANTLWCAT